MSKNNKMSKEDRIFIELISSLFSEDEINELTQKLKKDCQKKEVKEIKEILNQVMDDVNKAKEVKSCLCLINFGEKTLASCGGYGYDIIDSVKTTCSNIREDEEDKKILWRNIAETILEVLGENNE